MRYFVLMIDGGTVAQRDAISNHIKAAGCAWWHHMQHNWLVRDPRLDATAERWATEISNMLGNVPGKPGVFFLVLEVNPPTPPAPMNWFGFLPEVAFPWIHDHWGE